MCQVWLPGAKVPLGVVPEGDISLKNNPSRYPQIVHLKLKPSSAHLSWVSQDEGKVTASIFWEVNLQWGITVKSKNLKPSLLKIFGLRGQFSSAKNALFQCVGMWVKQCHKPLFDGLYHPFMVILGMVYDCFNHISDIGFPTGLNFTRS